MNLLLDTNIFVPLEPAGSADVAVNTPLALEFQRLATRARVSLRRTHIRGLPSSEPARLRPPSALCRDVCIAQRTC